MIRRDPQDPCGNGRIPAKAIEMFENAQESLLGHILGVLLTAGDAAGDGKHATLKPIDELCKGIEVAAAGACEKVEVSRVRVIYRHEYARLSA
jgi:hypothetical protein